MGKAVEVVGFVDRETFEKWLEGQSREVCLAISVRAAIRLLPFSLGGEYWRKVVYAPNHEHEQVALITCWCCIICCSEVVCDDKRLVTAAETLTSVAMQGYFRSLAHNASKSAVQVVARDWFPSDSALAVHRAVKVFSEQTSNEASHAVRNASNMDAGFAPVEMLEHPLWHDKGWPEEPRSEYLGKMLLDTDPRFDFFKRWYDGMLRGAPLDWELQRRVALIPQETWEAGADAVAEAIAEIEARYEVQKVAADLSAERDSTVVQNRLGIGGNSPPESIDVPAEVVTSQMIIWSAVEEVAEEAEAETPDKVRLAKALEALRKGLAVCLKWMGRKADLAVDTTIKEGLTQAIKTGGYLYGVKLLIDAVEKWLPFLL